MDINNLQCVVGAVKENEPAVIRFYGPVNDCSVRCFAEEFTWLTDYIKPSKITVAINSEGGSVVRGMEVFALIQSSKICVETVVDGIAASMGSIIWAAGEKGYMRDYSLLMIHNPLCRMGNPEDPDTQQTVAAFKAQIETIYQKRFGMKVEDVRKIMDGNEGCDGTYFTAKQAVEAGFISKENIIKTPKQVRAEIEAQLEGVTDSAKIQEIMDSACAKIDAVQPEEIKDTIHEQKPIINKMTENQTNFAFETVCASLQLAGDSEVLTVTNRIAELQGTEAKLADLQAKYDELNIQKAGVDAQIENVNKELTDVKAELKKYQDAEQAAKNAAIEAFVDKAISEGRITAESKESWITMAKTNFDMVQSTINSITPVQVISEEIAKDPANQADAEAGMTETERDLAKKIEDAVGADFAFKTLD